MMVFQQTPNQGKQKRSAVWLLILLLLTAALLWILNSVGIIQGPWSTVLNATFTCIGAILSLLQWRTQTLQESPRHVESLLHDDELSYKQFVQGMINKRKGAVLVYTSRRWRGATLHLVPGLQETVTSIEAAANVVERRITGRHRFLCHFPFVPPGHYTIVGLPKKVYVHVTVHAGHISEIDWR